MKNFRRFLYLVFSIALIGNGSSYAQSLTPQLSLANDSLKGFDETRAVFVFDSLGYDRKWLDEYLTSRKRNFIDNKYNVNQQSLTTISDPFNPPIMKDGKAVYSKYKNPIPTPQATCNNVDFETGNFAGWVGRYGVHPLYNPAAQRCTPAATPLCPNAGFIFGRHTIMSGAGFDPVVGAPLKMVAPGGAFSLRLGNSTSGGQAEQIEQTFLVSPGNTSFTYKYAVVLDDPSHPTKDQPFFSIRVYNAATGALVNCAQYYVSASAGVPGFQTTTLNGRTIRWKNWTTVNVDLSAMLGQNVTVRFTTSDCNYGGHFGYAYLDGDCLGIQVTQSDTLCQGSSVVVAAPAGSATYSWSPGGQTTQNINVSAAGTYSVTMTSVQGCVTKSFVNVNMHPKPNASVNPVQGVCSNTVTFNDASTISSGSIADWRYLFGTPSIDSTHQQNPSFVYNTPGTYTVNLIVTSGVGCKDTVNTIIAVPTQPTVNFNNTTVCQGDPTQFTDLSAVNPGNITAWQWDFGDPGSGSNTSTDQNPSHSYSNPGTYWVKLKATTNQGCTDSITLPVVVNAIPIPNFAVNAVCEGVGTKFTDASFVNPGAVTQWDWAFGDGNTSSLRSPTHTYASAGVYNATLTAYSNGGCPASIVKSVTVNPPPATSFTASASCLGSPTNFSDQSVVPGGSIAGWIWDFGEPASGASNTSNAPNPSHTYTNTGTYSVSLTATSNKGCQATYTNTVIVHPPANPDFTSLPVCTNNPTSFADASTVPTGTITDWLWDFGEPSSGANNTSNSPNPQHIYAACDTFNASLVITTSYGCQSLVIKEVIVNCLPQVQFNANNACEGSVVNFNNTSTIQRGSLTGYAWNFGDPGSGANNTSTLANPNHVFSGTGGCVVSLTATSDSGCQASLPININIDAKPDANFTGGPACEGIPINFNDQSTITSGNIIQWYWNFADPASGANNSSSLQNPTHSFAGGPGIYSTTLLVASASNCWDSISIDVTVNPTPVASFTATEVCFGETTVFSDQSTIGGGGTITSWSWDFDDPASGANNTSTDQNPTHDYVAAGIYTPTLTVTSGDGCPHTAIYSVTVNPLPVPSFTNTTVCLGTATQFTSNSSISGGTIAGYTWNFGDGAGTSNQNNPSYLYAAPGDFTVSMVLTSDKGCMDSVTNVVTVYDNPVVGFAANDTDGCRELCVQFTDTSTVSNGAITGWLWDFGDGNTSTQQNPLHCYDTVGVFPVSLTVTTNNNCSDVLIKNGYITVYPVPVAEFSAQPQPTTILDPVLQFTDLSTGADSWYWYYGDGDSSAYTDQTPTHGYADTGRYEVKLVVMNQYGCMDSIIHEVIIGPDFIFYIPNAFTPNGDSRNEEFFPEIEGVEEFEMLIYDRWGNKIWETDNINAKWDGKFQGNLCQQDVYVWVIRCVDIFNKRHRYVGKVTLLR